MNEVKLVYLFNNEHCLEINGKRFPIYSEIVGYTKKLNPKYHHFVRIAPEYNPSGIQNLYAKTHQALVNRIESLDYKISTIQGYH